jgi:Mrp family chromosome partitioning ATPase/capsular polysaccharide biosynthesis protein
MDERAEQERALRMRHLRRDPGVDLPYIQRVPSARTSTVEPIDYLGTIRRRWPVLVVLTLLGLGIGYVTAKPASATVPVAASYQATAILGVSPATADPTGLTLDEMAFLATSGPVPAMTARSLGDRAGAHDIAGRVQVTANDSVSVLEVSASEPSANRSAEVANSFSGQLIAFFNNQLLTTRDNDLSAAQTQLKSLSSIIAKLQAQPASTLVASELSQARSSYAQQYVSYQQLLLSGPNHTSLHALDAATASAAILTGGTSSSIVPSSKRVRVALGGLAGLLAALALALVWERFDTRIRTREQAERIFELPVMGVIPRITRSRSRSGLVVTDDPVSAAAESFRMLQTGLARSGRGNGPAEVILLTSPSRLEGKEVVIANLAASFSEAGSSVALVAADSFDLSLPTLVGGSVRGTSSRLRRARSETGSETSDPAATATRIQGVSLLMNGVRPELGNGHAQRHVDLVATARRLADVVLIDTPPVLVTHDAGRLSPLVDSVVLMCELGRVTAREARLAVEALQRVGAPLQGVILVPKARVAARLLRPSPPTAGAQARRAVAGARISAYSDGGPAPASRPPA